METNICDPRKYNRSNSKAIKINKSIIKRRCHGHNGLETFLNFKSYFYDLIGLPVHSHRKLDRPAQTVSGCQNIGDVYEAEPYKVALQLQLRFLKIILY